MTKIRIPESADATFARMITTHSLPSSTRARIAESLEVLSDFPYLGRELSGNWEGYRAILGPWRWLIIVYRFHEDSDEVVVHGFFDARSSRSPTST